MILDHRTKGSVWGQTKPKRVEFRDLLAKLTDGGVPMSDAFTIELERLRLITNVQKHYSNALTIIARDHRDLLWGWQPGIPLTSECLALTPELFEGFVATLADFWRAFPAE